MNLWKKPADTPSEDLVQYTNPVGEPSEPIKPEPPLEAGSWERPRQELPVPPVPDRRIKRGIGRPPVARDKRRHGCVSVVVNDEEEAILRAYAATLEISFSSWARKVLFEAAKRPIPSRRRAPLVDDPTINSHKKRKGPTPPRE